MLTTLSIISLNQGRIWTPDETAPATQPDAPERKPDESHAAERLRRLREAMMVAVRGASGGPSSDHLEVVPVRQRRERRGRQRLVPEGDRGDVVLQRQVAAVLLLGAPAERLDGHAQVASRSGSGR